METTAEGLGFRRNGNANRNYCLGFRKKKKANGNYCLGLKV